MLSKLHVKFPKMLFFTYEANLTFSRHAEDRRIPIAHCKKLEQILHAPPFCQLVVTVSLQDWCTAREWIE